MPAEPALTIELRYLVYTALLALVLWMPYVMAAMAARGPSRVAGYPTGAYGDLPDWAQRSQRVHANLVENLVPFAALVIVAHLAGTTDAVTAFAVRLFFWARVAQAIVHMLGVPWLRTLAFFAGWIGNLIILWRILY